jgi:DNA-binding transcriptional MerR regulator
MTVKNKEASAKPAAAHRTGTKKPAIAHKAGAQKTLAQKSLGLKKEPPEDILIPDKLYFRIGEVSRLCRLPAYVLRFWESEFPQLHPVKGSTGQRNYRRRDVEVVVKIKDLLYRQGFTIPGARQHLRDEVKAQKAQAPLPFPKQPTADLARLRAGLQEILEIVTPPR